MRHRRATVKLGRTPAHRRAMLRNMVTSLFREERVVTTIPKAKECRRVAERMITFAKRGDLHARRQAARMVRDDEVLKKLFDEIAKRFAERPGGYTRILKTRFRAGDNADMSLLELLPDEKAKAKEEAAEETQAKAKPTKAKKKDKEAGERMKGEILKEKRGRGARPKTARTAGPRKAPRKASKRGD
ncbi:MAG: 50S ribosomal protein L17 [bacterium]